MSITSPEDDVLFGELRHGGDSAGRIVRLCSVPAPTLADIGGLKEEQRRLQEAVELPLKLGEALRKKGIQLPKEAIVYGPPGTGKTMLIKAFAADAGLRLFVVRWPQLVARSDDDSRRLLADTMARARANMPSVVLIDDLEYSGFGYGQASELSRKKSAQITEAVDSVGRDESIAVILVSSSPDTIDPALRKAGSMVEEIEFRLPGADDRKAILSLQTRGLTLQPGVDLARIAAATDGFTGAGLALLVQNAFLGSLRRAAGEKGLSPAAVEKATVTDADFRLALQGMQRQVQPDCRGEVN